MNGNEGLAKAYNQALKIIGTLSGYVIWSDDDTIFPDCFFAQVMETIEKSAPHVLLPLVYSNNKIYSPNIIDTNGLPRRIESLEHLEKNISGINSGMIVKLDTYSVFHYDEGFFLDFIDHDFCSTCSKNGISIEFNRDIILHQNAFFDSKTNFKKIAVRRKIYRNDFIKFCDKHNIPKTVARKKIFHGEILTLLKLIKQIITDKGKV